VRVAALLVVRNDTKATALRPLPRLEFDQPLPRLAQSFLCAVTSSSAAFSARAHSLTQFGGGGGKPPHRPRFRASPPVSSAGGMLLLPLRVPAGRVLSASSRRAEHSVNPRHRQTPRRPAAMLLDFTEFPARAPPRPAGLIGSPRSRAAPCAASRGPLRTSRGRTTYGFALPQPRLPAVSRRASPEPTRFSFPRRRSRSSIRPGWHAPQRTSPVARTPPHEGRQFARW